MAFVIRPTGGSSLAKPTTRKVKSVDQILSVRSDCAVVHGYLITANDGCAVVIKHVRSGFAVANTVRSLCGRAVGI